MLNDLRRVDPEIYDAVKGEVRRQHVDIELIASENYVSLAVLDAVWKKELGRLGEHCELLGVDPIDHVLGCCVPV